MHDIYLKKILLLAQQRRGFCAPNPAVGAIVVKNDQMIAEGYHWQAGEAHAERVALDKISLEMARDSTVYVTLEPCCHHGKTPPCTALLIEKQVGRVFYAYRDPDARVAGKGVAALEAAGIPCQLLPSPEISAFYQSYQYWQQTKLPYITAKLAMSLDAKIAHDGGQPAVITGSDVQVVNHQHRKAADVILTTVTTVINDDPQLNVRFANESVIAKHVFILDRLLRLPLQARVLDTALSVTVFYDEGITDTERLTLLQSHQVTCIPVPTTAEGLCLLSVFKAIGAQGYHDCWVEVGGRCLSQLLRQQLLQKLILYIAPIRLGEQAIPAFPNNDGVFEKIKTAPWQWEMIGNTAMGTVVF